MKTRLFNVWGIITALLIGLASCTPKSEEIEAATLSVSTGELTFQNAGGSESVKITTNQESWMASCPQEGNWIELTPSGNSLLIKTTKNEISEARVTYVIISAGGATPQKVKVTQNPAGISLAFAPEVVNVPNTGGTYTIDISSNTDVWDLALSPDVEWVTVATHKTAKMAYLTVAENTTTEAREVVLRASNKAQSVELLIKQEAAPNLRYIMPMLDKRVKTHDLIEYEIKRKGFLKFMSNAIPDFGMFEEGYTFSNKSELFPETIYRVHSVTRSLTRVIVHSKNFDEILAEKEKIVEFYKENEFDFSGSTSGDVIRGRHKSHPFEIEISFNKNDRYVNVIFSQYAKQPKPYPTFEKMPAFPVERIKNSEWKIAQVEAAETAAGMIENLRSEIQDGKYKGQISLLLYNAPETKRPLVSLGYIFDWKEMTDPAHVGEVNTYLEMYSDTSLAFWHDKEISNTMVLTDEFKELLKNAGWSLYTVSDGTYVFYKSSEALVLGVAYSMFEEVNDGAPVLHMQVLKQDLGGGENKNDAVLKRVLERLKKGLKPKK